MSSIRRWCGGSARIRMRAGSRRGFTLVELLIVIAIIALLIAIILPSMSLAKEVTYRLRCRAHLHQILTAVNSYASVNRQYLPGLLAAVDNEYYVNEMGGSPGPWGWRATTPTSSGLLWRGGFLQEPDIWLCPAVHYTSPGEHYGNGLDDPWTYHFTTNARTMFGRGGMYDFMRTDDGAMHFHRRASDFKCTSRTILLAEENSGMISQEDFTAVYGHNVPFEVINDEWFTWPDLSEPRHLGDSQVGWLDGHATEIDPYIPLWDCVEYGEAP
mgnify:CR=1 FL=1